MTEHPGTLTGICFAIFLMNRSLAKLEQQNAEVLKELNASRTRETAVSEARKVERAAFEEATKRLENRVGSLEAELERSRDWYVVCSMSRFGILITP